MAGSIVGIGLQIFSAGKKSAPKVLNQAMKIVEKRPITWTSGHNGILEVNLGHGIKAILVPGSMESDATVFVSNGASSIKKEFPEMWLNNWSKK